MPTTLDFESALRSADPARFVEPLDANMAAAVIHRLTTPAQNSPATAPPRASRPRRRRLVLAAAAIVALAAVPVLSLGGEPPSASAEASAVLDRAAALVPNDPAAKASQYWRIEIHGRVVETAMGNGPSGTVAWTVDHHRTLYKAVDGTRPTVLINTYGDHPILVSGPAGATAPIAGTTAIAFGAVPNSRPGNWQGPTPAFLAGLPRDVDGLRARLYADAGRSGPSPDAEVVVYVGDLLRSGMVPADLRKALFDVLKTVPGVEVTSPHAQSGGTSVVAIGRQETVSGLRLELLFSATGEYVGVREVDVRGSDGVPAGTVVEQTTVSRDVVDSVPADVLATAVHDPEVGP